MLTRNFQLASTEDEVTFYFQANLSFDRQCVSLSVNHEVINYGWKI